MNDKDELPSLEALSQNIDRLKQKKGDTSAQQAVSSHSKTTSLALRAGIDFVSGFAVGTVAGYLLDRWLDTLPIFMLIGMCLGLGAGIRLLMETARRAEQETVSENEKE